MKTHNVVATHTGGIAFDIQLEKFHVVTDGPEQIGGQDLGPRPKPLLLAALAGCSGIDVVGVLKKQRIEYSSMRIDISGESTDDIPSLYTKINVRYVLQGVDLPRGKIERAVGLSIEKYCSVAATLRQAGAEISWEVELVN